MVWYALDVHTTCASRCQVRLAPSWSVAGSFPAADARRDREHLAVVACTSSGLVHGWNVAAEARESKTVDTSPLNIIKPSPFNGHH